jgi:malonyl CoA-acyl carrier protein transacylase
MGAHGVDEIWEIGAGKALSGMIRRINREIATARSAPPTMAAVEHHRLWQTAARAAVAPRRALAAPPRISKERPDV